MRKYLMLALGAALGVVIGIQAPAQASEDDIVIGFAIAQSGWMNA